MDTIDLGANEVLNVPMMDNWSGNFITVVKGVDVYQGMLGEMTFNSWGEMVYFDVSAIVNPDDHDNVKELFPKNTNLPMAGCQDFPCNNVYNVWNEDYNTKTTLENQFICLVGTLDSTQRRREKRLENNIRKPGLLNFRWSGKPI